MLTSLTMCVAKSGASFADAMKAERQVEIVPATSNSYPDDRGGRRNWNHYSMFEDSSRVMVSAGLRP